MTPPSGSTPAALTEGLVLTTVVVGSVLESTPEGLYWADRARAAEDALFADMTPAEREIVDHINAAVERAFLFGDGA